MWYRLYELQVVSAYAAMDLERVRPGKSITTHHLEPLVRCLRAYLNHYRRSHGYARQANLSLGVVEAVRRFRGQPELAIEEAHHHLQSHIRSLQILVTVQRPSTHRLSDCADFCELLSEATRAERLSRLGRRRSRTAIAITHIQDGGHATIRRRPEKYLQCNELYPIPLSA